MRSSANVIRHRLAFGASAAVLAIACAAPAMAQDVAAQDSGTADIIVTGFRNSVENAQLQKRESTAAVDVIKAEDIAKFPDNNLAESLQRIPGVAISREGGEGRAISVRGLGPEYTRVRINGMEAVATTGGSDAGGGVNRGRGFDFNVFASELFNSLTVRKTASASVEEGSLGATVDLQAARPLDYKDNFTIAGSARAGYNDLSKAWDPRLAGLVSWQNPEGTFGVLASAAYSTRTIEEKGHSTVRWSPSGANGGFNAASTLPGWTVAQINRAPAADGSNWDSLIYHPRIPRYDSWSNDIKRLGLTGAVQWQPSDRTEIVVEGLYSKAKTKRNENYIEALSFSRTGASGKSQTIIRTGEVNDDNELVYGVFDDVDMRIESRHDEFSTTFYQYNGIVKQELSDTFRVNAYGGYSKSKFDSPVQTTVVLDRLNSDGFSWDYRDNDRSPVMNWGFDPNNPANWSFINGTSDVRIRQNQVTNDYMSAKLGGEWDVADGFKLSFGGEYRRFRYETFESRRFVAETSSGTLTPAQIASLTSSFNGVTGDPQYGNYLVPNLQGFVDQLKIYCNCVTTINGQSVDFRVNGRDVAGTNPNATAASNTGNIKEVDKALWFQIDFERELGGITFRGDAGVRYVKTEQTSFGYGLSSGTAVPITVDRSYENWLPSMNLVAELTPNLLLRFGAAQVITRPGLGALSPGGNLTLQAANQVFNQGNPFLNPTEAFNLDLAAEWYFAKGSLLGVSLFQKDIGSLSGTQISTLVPFNQLGFPINLATDQGLAPDVPVTVRRTINGDGGKLQGFEINYQHQLSFLPGFLKNVGVLANYTYVKADLKYPGPGGVGVVTGPLTNLSKHTANATLFYEDSLINLRGSVSYRSKYVEAFGGGAREQSSEEGVNSSINVDASLGINVTKAITLTIEGNNLTNERKDQYIDANDRVVLNHQFGRQFYFGVRFKY
ncbi:TonB-dependent receptor [Sphingobium chlorophenolicum L-1]|uniref:TonB-dependent receptor n=1 Tax=Sphingobium chlorophenolicum L-1 TaxID=690566 RepID=F6F2Q4_SPHCR|nr:TonB-dependent receptor [Sphingobium chlorophenolicum]AEG50716.1 TonB-dependent receptor [Sphingobium chlorophenolicum L-1]